MAALEGWRDATPGAVADRQPGLKESERKRALVPVALLVTKAVAGAIAGRAELKG